MEKENSGEGLERIVDSFLLKNCFFRKHEKIRKWVNEKIRVLAKESSAQKFMNSISGNGMDAVKEITSKLKLKIETEGLENIPEKGAFIVVANHPLGMIDGLTLLREVGMRRKDIKIIVNQVLRGFSKIEDLFLPIDVFQNKTSRKDLQNILETVNKEQGIIIFPAGSVSRKVKGSVQDDTWSESIFSLAQKYKIPLIPTVVDAKNSALFYKLSQVNNRSGTLLLAREALNAKGKKIKITFLPPEEVIAKSDAQRIRKKIHTYLYKDGK